MVELNWKKICDDMKDEFINACMSVKHAKAGVCYHEALAFAALCKHEGIEVILESGTASGISTRLWAEMFPSTKIVTVDNLRWEKAKGLDLTRDRATFKNYTNIEFHVGDSQKIFEDILIGLKNKRIAIFLDGPKDLTALKLAEKLLKNKDIGFVAIDDMGQTKNTKRGVHVWNSYVAPKNIKKIFHTTKNPWYHDRYGQMDVQLGNKEPVGHGIGFLYKV